MKVYLIQRFRLEGAKEKEVTLGAKKGLIKKVS